MAGVSQSSAAQEFTGKSVEEATAEGLRRMGLRADEVTVEVVNRGSRGLFGIGSEAAVVRIARVSAAESEAGSKAAPSAEKAPAAAPPAPAAPLSATPPPAQTPVPASVQTVSAPAEQEVIEAQAASAEPVAQESAAAPATAEPERDDQVIAMATEMLTTLVHHMGFNARVQAEWRDADAITDERHLLLSVHGENLSPLIGRRGDTLENIQYLLRLMVNQKLHHWLNIIVDVEEFRAKRVEHLTHLAQRMAEQVATTDRSFALEPMPPNERRIIHLALRDHEQVYTESTGEGERRKVIILPKK